MEQEAPATTTERVRDVTLRPLDLADADAMMAWVSDPEVTTFMTWDPYMSRDALLAFLRDAALPHPWFGAVCLPGGDRPVSSVSMSPTADACRAELGYVVARAHWGKGVATAAVKRAVATVFKEVEGLGARGGASGRAQHRVAARAGEGRVPAGGRAAEVLRGQGRR
ncbi:hypothetical protein CFC21_052911 [Triticum aestivum]|uniref:N-acetyltransferase domain-containing protein n=2 Tax=Triticum aestivum TaxID=4565 RepID=A0A3B6HXW2_WHEAT|nr:hypothetical protein CFC21_052911 [Triticum aestivum]